MSSDKINRREFLKLTGCSSLFLTLPIIGGCGEQGQETETNTTNSIPDTAANPSPDIPADTTTYTVSLVKNFDDSYAINRAIELAGGLDFLSAGDSVLLKLALNSPNPFPATTSPLVVAELIRLLQEKGAGKIYVGDKSPSWRDTLNCMEKTGIYQAAVDNDAEIAVFEDNDMVHVRPSKATHWPSGFFMPELFNQVDHIIALPTLRTHSLADFTMGIKIFVGVMPQIYRRSMHDSIYFFERIAEIPLCTEKIRLSLLDAREGFNTEGPDSGNLIAPGIILAGKDYTAVDVTGLALLKTFEIPYSPLPQVIWNHPIIKRSLQVHSPNLSSQSLKLVSEGIANIKAIQEQLS